KSSNHTRKMVYFCTRSRKIDEEFEVLVIGHEHPALALTDEIG
ncbi:hypothetical protein HRED_03629, partial [Candidatus Haloredivivus sp. G17]